MRHDIAERKSDILAWIGERLPKAQMCERLNCRMSTLESWLKRLDIEYKGNQGRKGNISPAYIPAIEYSQQLGIKPYILKLKLLKEGIKENECEECGHDTWNGKPIPIEMDHVDGNRFNNNLSNLRMLCCNCHAQTETYCKPNK
jgi:hypothetical protein